MSLIKKLKTWIVDSYLFYLIYPVLSFFYKLLILLNRRKTIDHKYKISVCTIFKDEAFYLKEWIEYHKLIGIDHFYLYNNFSSDDYLKILKPYLKDELITLIDWPVEQGQLSSYQDCLSKYKDESEWLGFIDIDEFIVPIKEDSLYSVLKKYKNYPSVLLNWRTFGTSGYVKRDVKRLVIKDFTMRQSGYHWGKSFYNTKFNCDINSCITKIHFFYAKCFGVKIPPVNLNKKFYFGKMINVLNRKEGLDCQINHYYCKSYDEYRYKIQRGDVYWKESSYDYDKVMNVDKSCSVADFTIYKYLLRLKIAMKIED